jgi:uncharacterized protein (TIGR03437 family)
MALRWVAPLCVLLHGSIRGAEPPAIRRQGVVNAASQRPAAVGGGIARGSRISIYGVGFGAVREANRVALWSAAGEVRWLKVIEGDTRRLEAWIPTDAPLGTARITVSSGGIESAPEPVTVLRAAPGLFSTNGEGWGPARAENLSGAARLPNSAANSLAPGARLALAVTGLAPSVKPEVRLGNTAARVVQIRAAGPPGYTAEIVIETPPDVPEGCYVPLYVRMPGAPLSNAVTVSVHRGGGKCVTAPEDPLLGWQGGKTGIVSLTRTVLRTLDAPAERIDDEANAAFLDVPAGKVRASPLLLLPPVGACTTWAGALKADTTVASSMWALLFGGIPGQGLDAGGSIFIRSRALQLKALPVAGAPGLYRRMLSTGAGRFGPRNRLTLDAGPLGIVGSGGAQVGPFAVSLPAPAAFTISTPPDPVDRRRPLTLEWSPGNAAGSLAIVVFGADANQNVAGLAYCNAPKAAARFTIPADFLAQVPPGRGSLVMTSWSGRAITPPPDGIAWMTALSVFARSSEVTIH